MGAGERFERRGPRDFSLRPEVRGDFAALFGDLEREGLPDAVLYLWTVTPGAGEEESRRPPAGPGVPLPPLSRPVAGELQFAAPVEVVVVANELLEVGGEETIAPMKALLLGPCRVIPLEYAGISCRAVDVVWPPADEARGRELVARLAAEPAVAAEPGGVLAYRGGYRWARDFTPVRLEPAGDRGERAPALLRRRGVYLITGGLGGLGLLLAEHLARTAAARLVLVGRSQPTWRQAREVAGDRAPRRRGTRDPGGRGECCRDARGCRARRRALRPD